MPRRKKEEFSLKFTLNFTNYLQLVKFSILKPNLYVSLIPQDLSFLNVVVFFLTNIIIGLILQLIKEFFINRNSSLVFFVISQIIFLIPFFIVGYLIFCFLYHLLAKLLGGRGSFKSSLIALSYSSIPIIFFWIPIINLAAISLSIFLAILSFQKFHQLSKLKSAILVLLPIFILLLITLIFGLIGFLFLL